MATSLNEMSVVEAISAYGLARSTITGTPLSPEELDKIDAYWRASLYLSMGMLYLKENPLLREPLKLEHIKARLLGHWGSDAVGQHADLSLFQGAAGVTISEQGTTVWTNA